MGMRHVRFANQTLWNAAREILVARIIISPSAINEPNKKPPNYVGRDEDKREVFLSQHLQACTSLTLWTLAHLLGCDKLSCTHVCDIAYQFE